MQYEHIIIMSIGVNILDIDEIARQLWNLINDVVDQVEFCWNLDVYLRQYIQIYKEIVDMFLAY